MNEPIQFKMTPEAYKKMVNQIGANGQLELRIRHVKRDVFQIVLNFEGEDVFRMSQNLHCEVGDEIHLSGLLIGVQFDADKIDYQP